MSGVNFLEKLLGGVAVEWKDLGVIATLRRGRVMSKEYLADNIGEYPVYSSQTAKNGEIGSINTFDFDGEFISWTTDGANAGTIFHRKEKFSITNVCGLININNKNILNCKYLFYWLTTEAKKHVYSGMGNPKLMSHQVEKIPVPIPCPDNPKKSLEIQAEIVRILDAMTAHTAELTAELTARKKQYNYYRDKLLSFEDGEVEWLDLDTLTKIKTGQSVNKQMISDNPGEYAVINSGREPLGFIDLWNTDNDPIGITSRGAGVGSITWREGKYFRGNLNYSLTIKNKDKISIRYLYHILQKMQLEIQALCTFDGIPALNASNLKTLEIPVPSLDEQNRIVAILDKFDALTTSITEGLPREIELRQKQYAYYRDLLLNFSQPQKVEG